jgi:hypothetical protein
MNAQKLKDTARALVAGDKGLLAMDECRDGLGRWRFRLPAPSSNRLWRFGKARKPTCRRHSKLCIIEPGATGRRAVANTMPPWKRHEHDNKYPATHETCGIAKTERIPIMKPNCATTVSAI